MKKLEDYKGQKIAIHFPTYELWLRRKEINPSDSLCDDYWYEDKSNTCCFIDNRTIGEFGSIDWAKQNGYTILPATDFLEDELIYGQEYEFSDTKNHWHKRQFMVKTPCGEFISYNKDTKNTIKYKYARKINTERTEAIATIKELVSKHSINQNEVF